MSRDKGKRPHFTDASVLLNLRERDEGGPLLASVVSIPAQDTTLAREICLLVHGFNNHRGEAEFAYQGFRDRQNEQLLPAEYRRIRLQLRDTFWPGDADWHAADVVDFMVYGSAVGTAREAGTKLASFLAGLTGIHTIHFVGHSLGCRVVLETIRALLGIAGQEQRIGKLCLMAAAVPTFMLMQGGRLEQAALAPPRIFNLFSRSDLVLFGAFPPGQLMAGFDEGGLGTYALGRHGLIHPRITNKAVYKAAHGHYWGHAGAPGSAEQRRGILANKYVSELFGWTRDQSRTIDARQAAYDRETREYEARWTQKRTAASSRKIGSRTI